MAILLPTETKSTKGRLIHAGIITLLALGGVTMVYPFLVMLSGSVRSAVDEANLDLIPQYLVDDQTLYQKFLEFKYNGDVAALNRAHRTTHFSFQDVPPPHAAVTAWDDLEYITLPAKIHRGNKTPFTRILGGTQADRAVPANLRRIRDHLIERFDGDLNAYVAAGGDPTPSWLTVVMPPPRWYDRRYDHPDGPLFDAYLAVEAERPNMELQPLALSGHFLETMVFPRLGRNAQALAAFSETLGRPLEQWSAFVLPSGIDTDTPAAFRDLWIKYVRNELNPTFIFAGNTASQTPNHLAHWHRFLATQYATIEELNRAWSTQHNTFGDIGLNGQDRWVWLRGVERQDYLRFLDELPDDQLQIYGLDHSGQSIELAEWHFVQANTAQLRRQFAFRNYINVWDELAGEGRALWNTIIYCTLSIVLALLVNPLAAYGLSRFRLRGGYKALLILMATMAFPPMVTLIPQFIVLRNLGLMNTFVALLLPLIANGYLIFLLKGFFDSLPRELYEAGTIDGASELRMFFQIAMALSKPILAVVALQTFTAAYTMFLYALLVAPDRDMWLISVWLFQYQERASSSGVFASVVIASIPTLVLFLLVQRTIMRGIVVPTEK